MLVENRLFATLEATTRRLVLPGGEQVLMSDTVGFIKKLPHSLVQAFKSTLEEVAEVELLIHVVDASAPDPMEQISIVRAVLAEIGVSGIPELLVMNKADLDSAQARDLVREHPGSVAVSAKTEQGIPELLDAVSGLLRLTSSVVELMVPYSRGDVTATVHREGEVLSIENTDEGSHIYARLDAAGRGLLSEYVVDGAS